PAISGTDCEDSASNRCVTTPAQPPVETTGYGIDSITYRVQATRSVREYDDQRDRQNTFDPDNPEWNHLSERCQSGLMTAMTGTVGGGMQSRMAALGRAQGAEGMLMAAVAGTNIPWEMLAAIGIRESRFGGTLIQPDGLGRGIFQIDLGAHPDITQAQ